MESEMKQRDSTATTIVKQLGMVGLSFSLPTCLQKFAKSFIP